MSRYVFPAEWAPHAATFLTWAHDASIWGDVHAEVERTFARLAAELLAVERVHLSVPDRATSARVTELLIDAGARLDGLRVHEIASNDVWARDHGPTVVFDRHVADADPRVFVDWDFNAWGGKFPSALDDLVAGELAARLGARRIRPGIVLEGGGIEVNGAGDLLTTEAVLLNPNRNPNHTRAELEAALRDLLGVERIHWLGRGLLGDDTDGHIDDMARFVDERTIVVALPRDPAHPDYDVMRENLARLESFEGAHGPFRIVPLPVPEPVVYRGEHLPASYANFYLANGLALVPVFAQPTDDEALEVLRGLLPGRRVVGIDCRALVTQYGAIHCVTQQLPAWSALEDAEAESE
jgi:agmatine deiminase